MRKGQEVHLKKDLSTQIHNNALQLFIADFNFGKETNKDSVKISSSLENKRNLIIANIIDDLGQLKNENVNEKINIDNNLARLELKLGQYFYQSQQIESLQIKKTSFSGGKEQSIPEETGNEVQKPLLDSLYELQDDINKECGIINNKIASHHNNIHRDEKLIFSISVIYSILLSIFLSLFTASRISKPFRILSDVMDSSHDFNIDKESIQQLDKSSNEVKILVASFENLIDEVSHQLEVINEKSETLENQNEKLLVSERHLHESNKVKDKFFSILAHDLRGPFATIQSFLEILINHADGFTKEEITKLATEMSVTIEGVSALLENLLEWSRPQKGHITYTPSVLNIQELIEKNIQIIDVHASKKAISIQSAKSQNLFAIADYNMVDFILRNLLSNAIKFTSKNGHVRIEYSDSFDLIEISIIDNGIGIKKEDQWKIFDKDIQFSKIGTSNEIGTGLGLLLCKEFIEKCSGTIAVNSIEGKGATFTFTLPKQKNNEIT